MTRGKTLMDKRNMTDEQISAVKDRLVKCFRMGLGVEETCAQIGMTRESLLHWAINDRMLGHHLITAKAQFEAGLRLKEGDNTVIQAKVMKKIMKIGKGKKGGLVWTGEWEWTGIWEDKYHCDTYAHAKQKLYYLSVKGGYEYAVPT